MFALSEQAIDPQQLQDVLQDDRAGACVVFEGRVRDHNQGRSVGRLSYQAYASLAISEGERVMQEVVERHPVLAAHCVHRVGDLEIGDIAVWVGVSAAHRDAAFVACREIIDEIKRRVPIWKNEHYADGESGWIHQESA